MSSASVIPETAPFSPAQRAWLNGFFAGLAGSAGETAASASGAVTLDAPKPAEEESFPWHDPAIALPDRLTMAEGKPRERIFMAAMAQLDCGSCGYDCRRYAEAIACGKEKDLTRCSPGGRPTAQALKELTQKYPADQGEVSVPLTVKSAPKAGEYDRDNPYPARFIRARQLSSEGSSKDVRHVVVNIAGSGISYKPGDSLGVYVDNCPELCESILEALGADGAEPVQGIDGRPGSLRESLMRDYAIRIPTPDMLDLLSRCATDPQEKAALAELLKDNTGEALGDYEVLDLLTQFSSARPGAADFVMALAPLQPRLYSISSSQALHPDEVHLTVSVVRYTNRFGRLCRGVASGCLGERMRPGQRVRIFVHASDRFALPSDDELPVIMIGPGTGIAPFRAFLQERKARKARGMNWLFFGDQHEATDFLYRDELEQYRAEGLLKRLDVAFSRDQEQKIYVQHRMLGKAAEVWDWIKGGAFIYVCGDARRMASDVDQALRQIVASEGRMSDDEAKRFIDNLSRNRRYLKDVY